MPANSSGPISSAPLPSQGGRYSDYQQIAATSHSRIYCVQDGTRRLTLKALPEDSKGDRARMAYFLEREYSLLSQLESPYIIRAWCMTDDPEVGRCIVMEYVDGVPLTEWLETNPTREQRKRVLDELLEVTEYLHHKQVTHADIKPDNILITANGSHVKLIDFGLSDKDEMLLNNLGSTPAYAAPEQKNTDTQQDHRADVYALGGILQLLFPRRYRLVARRCRQANPDCRYRDIAAMRRAVRRCDRWWIPAIGVLVFALLVSLFAALFYHPLPTYSGTCGADVRWELRDSVLTIEGTGPMADYVTYDLSPWHAYAERIAVVKIEDGVTTVGDHTFTHLHVLREVRLSDDIRVIGWDALSNCYSLQYLKLPASLDTLRIGALATTPLDTVVFDYPVVIDQNIFGENHALRYLKLAEGMTTFPGGVVFGCDHLLTLDLPSTMQTIGADFLHHCRALQRIICRAEVPPVIDPFASLHQTPLDIPVYVPEASIPAYQSAPEWCRFTNFQPLR